MNAGIAAPYFISVGVLLMGAFNAALVARSSAHGRACWTFSAICLAFSFFQTCNVLQYVAPDLASALAAHKWVNFFSILIVPMIGYLVAAFDKERNPFALSYCIAALALAVMVYNYNSPLGYRFSALRQTGLTGMPWGEQLYLLSGEPTLVFRLMRLLSFAMVVYTIVFAVRIRERVDRLSYRLIWCAIGLMLVTTSFASLSDAGVLRMPYLGGFGFTFLAVFFSVLIRADISRRQREEQRIQAVLAHEVKGRQIADERAEHALTYDPLTNLPNRAGALLRLQGLLEATPQNEARVALFLIELDRFGIINGTSGHKVGDQLLIEVARRLQDVVRTSDFIARIGSGGFVVGASGLKTEGGATRLHEKLSLALARPFDVTGRALRITSTAGLAVFPEDGTDAQELLAAAQLALQDAKSSGTGSITRFHLSLKENMQGRIDFEHALREALENRQFFLCYQPQVRAEGGAIVCFEALIRWQHPVYGLVMPDRFIPLAESLGLIATIGAWVIDTACAQLARWQGMGFVQLKIAVNLSAQQLLEPALEQIVRDALQRHQLDGPDLELEITESVLMQDPDGAIERLSALRRLGVRLSIDDFGTGYSSLGYLKVLPVHAFKLDRSFIRDICKGGKDLEICATAIQLARNLGLEIVAEGVENAEQKQQLLALGCHLLQGYYFARPLAVDAATSFLEATLREVPA